MELNLTVIYAVGVLSIVTFCEGCVSVFQFENAMCSQKRLVCFCKSIFCFCYVLYTVYCKIIEKVIFAHF